MAKLTDKQEAFCQKYIIDFNATQAAIKAGYSKKTAQVISTENLSKPIIQNRIKELLEPKTVEDIELRKKVLEELKHIAFDDIKNHLEYNMEEGCADVPAVTIKASKDIDTRSVSSVKYNFNNGNFEFKLYCKDRALELLGKHLGLFNDKIDLGINLTPETITALQEIWEKLKP